jgi:hypothetical protein
VASVRLRDPRNCERPRRLTNGIVRLIPLCNALNGPTDSSTRIARARRAWYVARGWDLAKSDADSPADLKEKLAVTDSPFDKWYVDYMQPHEGSDVRGSAK